MDTIIERLRGGDLTLKHVNLMEHDVCLRDLETLIDVMLRSKCKVTKLFFDYTNIGDEGVVVISKFLKITHHPLKYISINGCGVSNIGLMSFVDAMKVTSCSLRGLRFDDNMVDDECLNKFIDTLKVTRHPLQVVWFGGNNCTLTKRIMFTKMLEISLHNQKVSRVQCCNTIY